MFAFALVVQSIVMSKFSHFVPNKNPLYPGTGLKTFKKSILLGNIVGNIVRKSFILT